MMPRDASLSDSYKSVDDGFFNSNLTPVESWRSFPRIAIAGGEDLVSFEFGEDSDPTLT